MAHWFFPGPIEAAPAELVWALVALAFRLAVLGLVVWGGIALVQHLTTRSGSSGAPTAGLRRPDDPEGLLAWRYAQGEIDDDEYRHRLDVLRSTSVPWSRSG